MRRDRVGEDLDRQRGNWLVQPRREEPVVERGEEQRRGLAGDPRDSASRMPVIIPGAAAGNTTVNVAHPRASPPSAQRALRAAIPAPAFSSSSCGAA